MQLKRIAYIIVGDVAIVNVKNEEELKEAKHKAQEILNRHPKLKAVYAKLETHTEFRLPRLILLLGENVNVTWHRENGLFFRVTLGRVYFNPRLGTEHLEVAKLLDEYGVSTVLDMFAGVGGYTLTIAAYSKTPSIIVANDLNPYAISDLMASIYRNRKRIRSKKLVVLCTDAHMLPEVLTAKFDAIIMDYPQASEEFLDSAARVAARHTLILLYRVLREGEGHDYAEQVVEKLTSLKLRCRLENIRSVLDYAPRKYIFRFILKCLRT